MRKFGEKKVHKIHLSEQEIYQIVTREIEARLDVLNLVIIPSIEGEIVKYNFFYWYFLDGCWLMDKFQLDINNFQKLIEIGLKRKYRKILVDIIVKPTKIKYNIYYKGLIGEYQRIRERKY